jgi:hypothetical protein
MPIIGGTFEGPRFSGTILPGDADWQSVRVSDGVAQIDARYMLRHDDGTLVTMTDRGVRRGPPEVMARLAAGEVQEGPHRWLTLVELCFRDAEVIELADGVGLQVDANPQRLHLAHGLEYQARHADLVKRQSRCQPADPAAGNENFLRCRHRECFAKNAKISA